MQLIFLRHAQSENNALYARTGSSEGRHSDPLLTALGHRQARLAAARLARPSVAADDYAGLRHNRRGFGLTHLYCSLLVRAVQTADYVAQATGLPLVAWPEIHEQGGVHLLDPDTGIDQGLPGPGRSFFETNYPRLILPDWLDERGWWNRPPETPEESVPRALAFWQALMARHGHTDDRVVIVSHGGFFQALLAVITNPGRLSDLPPRDRQDIWFGIANASISRFDIDAGFVAIRYLNDVAHLPAALISG